MTDLPPGAQALTGPAAVRVVEAALARSGTVLHDWSVRSVHQRGSSSVAVVYEVDVTDDRGRRDRLAVGHVSRRPVPAGATQVDLDGAVVHVWLFPHDPYLPGLPAAVQRREAVRLLQRVDRLDTDEVSRPVIRTRSYRPTRRAVVELRPGPDRPPAAYVKLLGDRAPERIRRRTRDLVAVHDHLVGVLPVPPVLEHDLDAGRVVLDALPGMSLRQVLRDGGRVPGADEVCRLLADLHRLPPPPTDADPDAYADVSRHVTRLARRLPDRSEDLARVAAVARSVRGPRGTVHGDLHDGQLLVTAGRISGLLDVDGVGTGRVAHDLGRLLAHVEASELACPDAADRVRDYVSGLQEACAGLAPAHDVAAAAAGAWLGLATGPLRVASPRWRTETAACIDRALLWAARAH